MPFDRTAQLNRKFTPVDANAKKMHRRGLRNRIFLGGLSLLLASLASSLPAAAQPSLVVTQNFSLAPQWNLISFQVIPTNPSPQVLFETLQGFQAAWTYDATTGLWLRYLKPSGTVDASNNIIRANQLLALPPIEPGRAYWISMGQSVASWEVSGTVPRGQEFPGLNLRSGWNLIGIPIGTTSTNNSERVSLLAVLTAAGFDYDAMLTWDSQSWRKMFRPHGDTNQLATNALVGLPPDPPFPSFDFQRDLGRGYWIHVLDPAIIRPRLIATVRPDIDAEPPGNFPAKEDLNVSGASRPKSVREQDVIRFFAGEDVQTLGISNLGDETTGGGGIMLWEAIWNPTTDRNTPEPWIRLFSALEQKERRDENGRLLSSHTNLTGVTTLENDIVYLRLDRKNLGRGNHEGTLLLRTSVGDKSYRVIAEVAGLEGDFKGFAVIHSVNGKRNPIPDIDLAVSFYEDVKVDGLLRGVIDSSQALLWPVDVPLVGYRVADEANQFILGGSFVLPPGDQNGEPFDQWDESASAAGADIDWLNDSVMDIRNPFPFPIQRSVSFEGSLVKANPTDGHILEGRYTEIIHGMSRQPITLAGVFRLERQAARALSTRRSVSSDTGVEPVVSKKSMPAQPLLIPAGQTRNNNIRIETEMDLRSLQVSLDFRNPNNPLAHSSLVIRLRSPGSNSVELLIYDGVHTAAINPKILQSITFGLERPYQGDLKQFLLRVRQTKTDPALGQYWTISIENAGNESVSLVSWTLRLEGQPVTDVFGVVKDESTTLSGVTVALDGVPFSLYSGLSAADGRFSLSRVPLLPLNFSAARPGYLPADALNPGLSANFTRPFIGQVGLAPSALEISLINRFNPLAGAPVALAGVPGFSSGISNSPFELQLRPEATGPPTIIAGPLHAFVGSTVDFYAANPVTSVRWVFGDGTTNSGTAASHVYQKPGYYRVRLHSPASSPIPRDSVYVLVLPAPDAAPRRPADLGGEPTGLPSVTSNATYSAYLFQPFFTTAGVLPARRDGFDPRVPDRYILNITPTFGTGETNEFGAALVSIMPIQHIYAASMDIDLAPHIRPVNASRQFNSDGFQALGSAMFDAELNDQGFRNEDFNYSHFENRWGNTRIANCTNDCSQCCEYKQDAEVGLIVWGNELSPAQNYSIQLYQARDGAPFSFSQNDAIYHPHRGTTILEDLETHKIVTHYRIACSMGATVLTAPLPSAAVKRAKPRRGQPDNPLDPELVAAPEPVSRNLYFRLHTGFLDLP